jgi:ACS family glucarate transporter-like MFS transporter
MGQDTALGRPRPGWVRYQVLAVGCSLAVVVYLHRVGFAIALPEIGLSKEQAGWIQAVFLLAYGLFEMPWGLLGDRLGTRHLVTLLVVGGSGMTAAVALAGLFPDSLVLVFVLLLANRFLFGAFQAGTFPVMSRMLTDWMPMQERGFAQGAVWMATRLGGFLAPWVFWLLLIVFDNWQVPLLALAAIGLVWCVGFWPWFRNRPEEMAKVNPAECQLIHAGRTPQPAGHQPVPWGLFLRSRSVWGLCLMYGCAAFAANFYVTLLPDYLRQQRHLGERTTTWLLSLPFLCGMATCLVGGLFSDWIMQRTGSRRWGRRLNGLIALGLGSLGWIAINGAQTPLALGFVLCFIFLCNDFNMGPAWAACSDVGERLAGTLGGAMNMVGSLTGVGGSLIAGYLFEAERPELVFLIYGAVYAVAALGWLLVDVTRPLESRSEDRASLAAH